MRRLLVLPLLIGTLTLGAQTADKPLRDVIDSEVQAVWKRAKLTPAGPADDATFLRRIYLDLTGSIPTAAEARKFLDDTSKDKRARLIDRLLADPSFGTQLAHVWDLLLFGRNPANPDATRNRTDFRAWLAKKFNDNEPYDRTARALLMGEEKGSELFLVQYRYQVEDATEAVSRHFLGTQLQCARCHDHPYEEWKQRDFYGMAGFLVRTVIKESGSGQKRMYQVGEKSSGEVLFSGSVKDARPGKKGDPVKPKFLGGKELDEPPLPKNFKEPNLPTAKTLTKPLFSRRTKLAEWVTAKDNPYFARATVNRVWGQFMGRGLVHPVDDLRDTNKPAMPDLLKRLTDEFVAHNFDLKYLIREIVNSKTYQLSDRGSSTEAMPASYERARVRPLSAEELLASIKTATGFDKAGGRYSGATEEYFRRYFGKPTNGLGEFQGGLLEHLFLDNSVDVRALITKNKGGLISELTASKDPWEKRVEHLFLAVLTRRPTAKEAEKFVAHLSSDAKKADALLEEAIWALLNTAEFRFNR